jgi:hypothetical protein
MHKLRSWQKKALPERLGLRLSDRGVFLVSYHTSEIKRANINLSEAAYADSQ